jgi:hypothetical protein
MNNPPAFPTGTGVTPYNPGMTLRDYFAANVLQGMYAKGIFATGLTGIMIDTAKEAYEMADAMLKAREA